MLSAAGMCGIMSMLIQGFTDYVWYNYRIFLMFWMVIGFTVAIGRAVRENTLSPRPISIMLHAASAVRTKLHRRQFSNNQIQGRKE